MFQIHGIYFDRVSTFQWKPHQTYVEDKCHSPDCFKGIYADVFHILQSQLNFTYSIQVEGPREQIGKIESYALFIYLVIGSLFSF